MTQYKSLISTQHPSHWEVVRNKAFLSLTGEAVGKRAKDFVLLSLTTNGIVVRDVESGKGKFPKDFDTYQIVRPNELVFCLFDIDETPRTVGLVEKEGMLTGAYTALNVNQKRAFPQFVYYYYLAVDNIKGLKPYYSGLRKTVRADKFLQIYIPLPPLSEQEKIVSYLDSKTSKIDSYVADKEKEILLLQELKQKTIAEAVTKGLNPNVKMKDSGISWLGKIPVHWETKRIASLFTGRVKANSDFEYHHAFKFYYGTLVPKEETGDIEEYRDTYVKYSVLQKDDIMINGLNLNYDFISQRVAIAPSDGIITSAYVVARPRKDTNAQYYNYLFKTMDNMKLFHGMGTGIRLTLSFDELKKQLVIVPPVDEQQTIVSYIEEKCQKIDILITELQAEIDYLKEYKQRLIADVVTGQVNVQNETI
ncbi:restriction endonuclease subunit S [Prevotella sp. E2-28]|uniref:restriction endonuclease subunit S n=1 Tax=Prevotella sp. E2-28 TaxID=2913620 RepID=UPI001ED9DF8B|nr:restriction endonuclease subunit S [Prevotella sp. E2-28]UKK54233.1 restriction endonuclease subunit S [Prevotella sp. E2-28]